MKTYLWKIEYDVIFSIRFTRERYIVTKELKPSVAESVFMKNLGIEEIDGLDFIRKIEFDREVISES